ncbi:MAG TPA: cation transporter [Alphaproteobacteria bacterium]|nr:cation transporter [Alphaproteobacteria bacterium]
MLRIGVAAAAIALVTTLSPLAARAAEKTVVLDVENATCELCGPIVKKTLSRVDGVKAVQVVQAKDNSGAVATVTFNDVTTKVETLVAAVTNAGFPSHLRN